MLLQKQGIREVFIFLSRPWNNGIVEFWNVGFDMEIVYLKPHLRFISGKQLSHPYRISAPIFPLYQLGQNAYLFTGNS